MLSSNVLHNRLLSEGLLRGLTAHTAHVRRYVQFLLVKSTWACLVAGERSA